VARRAAPSIPWIPICILLAAAAVRAGVLLQFGSDPLLAPRGVLDDAIYTKLAARVAAGDLALGPEPYFLAPFYTYFLGLVFALSGQSIAAARGVQILLGTAAVGLIMATASQWFGRRAGWVSGALAAGSGLFAFNEILILQSSVDPFLASLAVYLLSRALRQERSWWWLAAGAACGACVLNRPNALVAVAAVAAGHAALERSRASLRQAATFVVGVAIVLAPVTVRNRVVSGEWVLVTSHGGLNFYIGNGPGADGTWHDVPGVRPSIDGQLADVREVAARALGRPVSAVEASDYFYGLAWAWIRANPVSWAQLGLRKFQLALNATDVGLNYSYTYFAKDEAGVLSALVVGPWLVIPLGLFGLCLAPPDTARRRYVVWGLFAAGYLVSLAGFFMSSRYRLALLVPLVAASGPAMVRLWEVARHAPRRTQAIAGLGLAAAVVFVNWPASADQGRMYERGERIVQLFSDGRDADGRALLERTVPGHPDPGLLLYRIGLIHRERRDPQQAATYLLRAKASAPKEPRIDFNLGEALLEAGRPADAIPYLQTARATGVEPSTAAYDLVGAHVALGRPAEALAVLGSIEITPAMEAPALTELGSAALELQAPGLAARFLTAALARDPNLADAWAKLGVSLAARGRLADAIEALARSVRLNPQDTQARYALAMAYREANRRPQAAAELRAVLQIDPTHADAAHALAQLTGGAR
jgi:tetratricopeptide (TPR) repeat protein